MRIVFKNLDRSELAKEAVEERLGDMVEKFPELKKSRISVTLSMENSPLKAGPDAFTVRVVIQGKQFGGTTLSKTASSLYVALADVREHLLEVLNRSGDKNRILKRSRERRQAEFAPEPSWIK